MRSFTRRAITWGSWFLFCSISFARLPGEKPTAEAVDTAWKVLSEGAAEEKAAKRTSAIAALGTIGPRPEVIRLVEAGLADKDPETRQTAALALGQMKSRSSIPKLKKALDDENPDVSFSAARALWEMGNHGGRSVFVEVLGSDRNAPKEAVQAGLHAARKKLRNPQQLGMTGVKEGAHAFLGPVSIGVSVVEELTKDRTAQARVVSATLLATDDDPQSIQELKDALADKNWVVRAAAAKAIGTLSRPELIPNLILLLGDEKDAVRYMAAASVVRLSRGNSRPK